MIVELTSTSRGLIQASISLMVLTLLAWLWMVATRLPAMRRAGLSPQAAKHVADLRHSLPSAVLRISDNYNHLFEAPTVFYAVTVALILLMRAAEVDVALAWSYVALRVLHTAVQGTLNIVSLRFVLFGLSWLVLGALIVHAAYLCMGPTA